MDEDNDGRFPDDSLVEVRYPRTRQEELDDRSAWPWLPGLILSQCGPDEWYVYVEARELAMLDDGTPAPAGTAVGDLFFPCCFRDASELRRASKGRSGDSRSGGGRLAVLSGDHRRSSGPGLHPADRDRYRPSGRGLGSVICLNAIPAGWPAALILACLMPRRQISRAPYHLHRRHPRPVQRPRRPQTGLRHRHRAHPRRRPGRPGHHRHGEDQGTHRAGTTTGANRHRGRPRPPAPAPLGRRTGKDRDLSPRHEAGTQTPRPVHPPDRSVGLRYAWSLPLQTWRCGRSRRLIKLPTAPLPCSKMASG